jgi:hypothetical protein
MLQHKNEECTQTSGICRNFIDSADLRAICIEPYASIAAAWKCLSIKTSKIVLKSAESQKK